jgi:hypothetical protein
LACSAMLIPIGPSRPAHYWCRSCRSTRGFGTSSTVATLAEISIIKTFSDLLERRATRASRDLECCVSQYVLGIVGQMIYSRRTESGVPKTRNTKSSSFTPSHASLQSGTVLAESVLWRRTASSLFLPQAMRSQSGSGLQQLKPAFHHSAARLHCRS